MKSAPMHSTAALYCQKCGAEYHGLACPCFQVTADNEIEHVALKRFMAGTSPLFITPKKHILPQPHTCLTLCRSERVKKPDTRSVLKHEFVRVSAEPGNGLCQGCFDKVLAVLGEG